MWSFIVRRLLYSIPVYLGIILFMMAALRVNDPVAAYLGKNVTQETIDLKRRSMNLDRPFLPVGRYDPTYSVQPWLKASWKAGDPEKPERLTGVALYNPLHSQYVDFIRRIATFDFGTRARPYESWKYEGQNVGEKLRAAVGPTLAITIPDVVLTSVVAIFVGLISAYYRGTMLDRTLMVLVVLGMSVSVVVYIVLGQRFGAFWLNEQLGRELFAVQGYEPGLKNWVRYFGLPVIIGVVVAMGYDTRFYRAVMVEESTRDYIVTALAKGATKPKIMFVHMLKNAMIPIITRIMITLPFLIGGSILLETQFQIPGMGRLLIESITNKDFPIVQTFVAMFAGIFLLTTILTDILYALVDPRVRLS